MVQSKSAAPGPGEITFAHCAVARDPLTQLGPLRRSRFGQGGDAQRVITGKPPKGGGFRDEGHEVRPGHGRVAALLAGCAFTSPNGTHVIYNPKGAPTVLCITEAGCTGPDGLHYAWHEQVPTAAPAKFTLGRGTVANGRHRAWCDRVLLRPQGCGRQHDHGRALGSWCSLRADGRHRLRVRHHRVPAVDQVRRQRATGWDGRHSSHPHHTTGLLPSLLPDATSLTATTSWGMKSSDHRPKT